MQREKHQVGKYLRQAHHCASGNWYQKLRVLYRRIRKHLIPENASDGLRLAERAGRSVLRDLPQSGGIIFQQQNARRRASDSVSGQENRRQSYTNRVVQPKNKHERGQTTRQSRKYWKQSEKKRSFYTGCPEICELEYYSIKIFLKN